MLSALAWIITSLSPGPPPTYHLFSLTLSSCATCYQQLPLILYSVAFSPQTNLDSPVPSSPLSIPHPSNPTTDLLYPFSLYFLLFVHPLSLGHIPLHFVNTCSCIKDIWGEFFFPAPLHGQPSSCSWGL